MKWFVAALLFVIVIACEDGSRLIYPPHDQGTGAGDIDDPGDGDDLLNDDGQIVNDDGQVVNDDGQVVNDDGQVVNDDGDEMSDQSDGSDGSDIIVTDDALVGDEDSIFPDSDTFVDTTPPTVTAVSPADDTTDVGIATLVEITFSEPMSAATITGMTVMLEDGTGMITGTLGYDGPMMKATFTPDADLAYGTLYTVTVTTGAEDMAGNGLAAEFTSSFTTATAEINECVTMTNPCDDDGDSDATCTDIVGGYTCNCSANFTPGNGTCQDINECTAGTDNCAQNCTNTTGGFTCSCDSGYTLNGDGHSCDDINECTLNTDNCAQNCTNTTGSFTCSCTGGYTLNGDGHSCDDINECTLNTDNCAQNCTNTTGGFTCSCTTGYTLNGDGHSCDNINECVLNTDNCSANATCTDTIGSFTCDCNDYYTGTGVICTFCTADNQCGATCTACSDSVLDHCKDNGNGTSQCVDCTDNAHCALGFQCSNNICVDACECATGACCDGCNFRAIGYTCRAAVDPDCDVAETCTGSSADCPVDGFADLGDPCGDQTSGQCDDADACNGSGTCDPGYWGSGDTCTDGTFCNGVDTCNDSGGCSDHPGNPCGNFVCSENKGACCAGGQAGIDCEICVRFVKTGVNPGVPDGLSWNTAYNDIQAAIDSANGSSAATCEVWVAAGTYYMYKTATSNVIQLRGKVPLYGGFAGTEWLRDGRNWVTNVTTIDGHQSSGSATQVAHIMYGATGAILDGFTVTGGKAITGSASNIVEGGALYLNGISMTVRNTIFTGNSAPVQTGDDTARGGAVTIIGGGTNLFENCVFANNTVTAGNYDVAFGGAIYATGTGTTTVRNCILNGNTVTGGTGTEGGGGALNIYGAGMTLQVVNSLLYDNTVTAPTANGGAIRGNDATAIQVLNSTFSGNSADDNGGAIANMGGTGTTIVNSIFWGDNGAIANNTRELYDAAGGGALTATYSAVQMTNTSTFAGTGNINGDPLFVNAGGNDFHLKVDAIGMTYSPCIDVANDTPAPTTDLEGNARVNVPVIGTTTADMGCYEFQM